MNNEKMMHETNNRVEWSLKNLSKKQNNRHKMQQKKVLKNRDNSAILQAQTQQNLDKIRHLISDVTSG